MNKFNNNLYSEVFSNAGLAIIPDFNQIDDLEFNLQLQFYVSFIKHHLGQYTEKRLIGHKGNHLESLYQLGILEKPLDFMHVHSSLGASAECNIVPPLGTSDSYTGLLEGFNKEGFSEYIVNSQLMCKIQQNPNFKIIVFMPFPNKGFMEAINELGLSNYIKFICPISDYNTFALMENKLFHAKVMEHDTLQKYAIPRTLSTSGGYFANKNKLCSEKKINPNDNIKLVIQLEVSGGGDGTYIVGSEEEYNSLPNDIKSIIDAGNAKVSLFLQSGDGSPCYPGNGSYFIAPDGDVYINPISLKPVGLEVLGAQPTSGVGNMWGYPNKQVNQEYADMCLHHGKYMFNKHSRTGQFGPDMLVTKTVTGEPCLYVNEENPRAQGTDFAQFWQAMLNNRIPTELMALVCKIVDDKDTLKKILPASASYNQSSLNSDRGGFYIKIGGPKEESIIKKSMIGAWIWNGTDLQRPSGIADLGVGEVYALKRYNKKKGLEDIQLKEGETLVYINAPEKGTTIKKQLTPIGYIVGSPGLQVFKLDTPDITEEGLRLYNYIKAQLF